MGSQVRNVDSIDDFSYSLGTNARVSAKAFNPETTLCRGVAAPVPINDPVRGR